MKTTNRAALLLTGVLLSAALFGQDAQTLYNRGLELKFQKKIPEALDVFKQAVGLRPGYTEALYELGWCYNDLRVYDQAITVLRKAREGWPRIPKLHFELGYAFDKMEQTDSAIQAYQACLRYKPDHSGALRQLGYIAYNKDRYEEAIAYFRQYEAAAKADITDYIYFYRKGYMLNALKRFDSALIALERSERLNPSYVNTWLEKGYACTRLKMNDNAIYNFKKALELDPRSHIPYNGIGEVYRDNIKDRDEAINWYRKALEVKPNERKACYGLGYCYNAKGRFSEAIPWLQTAISQQPDYTAAYVELGYAQYKNGNTTPAITHFKKAIQLSPENENARYYLILVYVYLRDKAAAQKVLGELRQLGSGYVNELQQKINTL